MGDFCSVRSGRDSTSDRTVPGFEGIAAWRKYSWCWSSAGYFKGSWVQKGSAGNLFVFFWVVCVCILWQNGVPSTVYPQLIPSESRIVSWATVTLTRIKCLLKSSESVHLYSSICLPLICLCLFLFWESDATGVTCLRVAFALKFHLPWWVSILGDINCPLLHSVCIYISNFII